MKKHWKIGLLNNHSEISFIFFSILPNFILIISNFWCWVRWTMHNMLSATFFQVHQEKCKFWSNVQWSKTRSVDEVAAYMTWQVGAAWEKLVKNSTTKGWETLTAIVVRHKLKVLWIIDGFDFIDSISKASSRISLLYNDRKTHPEQW